MPHVHMRWLKCLCGAAYGVKSALEWQGILKPRKGSRKVEVKKRVVVAGEENEWLKGTNFNQVLFACQPERDPF